MVQVPTPPDPAWTLDVRQRDLEDVYLALTETAGSVA
jgi:hypothetical protein